jgi:predicted HAD superfamily Cof-like phosphohydrolase
MKNQIKKVTEFQYAFGQLVSEKPFIPDLKLCQLRYKLMKEENDEYIEACKNKDLVEIADALTDKLYILCGTIITHGMQDIIEKVFNEVHSSNMSKLDENGKPIYREDGKVLKGKNYFQPNIKQFLK